MRAVDLVGVQVQEHGVVVVLRERDEPHRILPIVVGGLEATAIVLGVTDTDTPRPLTHDLLAALVDHFGARLDRVEVTELDGSTFHADLVLDEAGGASRVDARPSDAIALAIRTHAPLFVSDQVLDAAGAEILDEEPGGVEALEPAEPLDPEAIEAEVDEFRAFLTDLDPDDFAG
jgi:bifunctional DNase/RNase